MTAGKNIQKRMIKRGKRVASVCLATGILLSSVPFYARADAGTEMERNQYEVHSKVWGRGEILLEKTIYREGDTVTFRLKAEDGYECSKICCTLVGENSEENEKTEITEITEETTLESLLKEENQETMKQQEEILLIKSERTEEIYEFLMPASNVSLKAWFLTEEEQKMLLENENAEAEKNQKTTTYAGEKKTVKTAVDEKSDAETEKHEATTTEEAAAEAENPEKTEITTSENTEKEASQTKAKAAARAAKGDIGVKQILDYPLDASGTSYLNYVSPISGKKMRVSLHRTSDDDIAYCLNRTKSSDQDDYNWDYDLVENKDTKYTDLQRNILLSGYPGNTTETLKDMYGISVNARTAEQATQLAIWIGNYMISEEVSLAEAWKSHAPYNTGDDKGAELCKAILERANAMLNQKLTLKGYQEKEEEKTVTYAFELTAKAQYYPVTGTLEGLPEGAEVTCDEEITCTDDGENKKKLAMNLVDGTAKISVTFSKYAESGDLDLKAMGSIPIPSSYSGILYYDNRDSDYQAVVQVKEAVPFYEEKEVVYHFEGLPNEAECKIIKKDRETGKVIAVAGTRFQIRKKDTGEIVSQHVNDSTKEEIQEFSTNEEGYVLMPEPLPAGTYLLCELEAPEGYVREENPVEFTVPEGTGETVEVVMENTPQRIALTVEKQGSAFCRMEEKSVEVEGISEKKTLYQPVFEEIPLEGVAYELKAAEDIKTLDGTCRIEKGMVFSTVTDSEGKAVFENLYPGRYELYETKTLDGYIQKGEPVEITLTYGDPLTAVKEESLSFHNNQQQPDVKFTKVMGENPYLKVDDAKSQVLFGLYAGEDLRAQQSDGTAGEVVISKDALLDIYQIGENGEAKSIYGTTLPYGKYYIEEMKTHPSYVLDTTQYAFSFSYDGTTSQKIEITAVRNPIENKPAEGTLLFTKQDETTGKAIPDCKVEIKNEAGKVLVRGTTDKNGQIQFKNLPIGTYTYLEYKAPKGYVLDKKEYPFEIKEDGQVVKAVMKNKKKSSGKKTAAKTGDWTPIELFGGLMAVSLGAGVGIIFWKKRNRK